MNQIPHFAYCFFEADEEGASNDRMADIELGHMRQTGHRLNVVEVQTMAGVDLQAQLMAIQAGLA